MQMLLTFLDDIYIASMLDKVSEAHAIVQEEHSTDAHTHLHHGQTIVGNRCGVESEGMAQLTNIARQVGRVEKRSALATQSTRLESAWGAN